MKKVALILLICIYSLATMGFTFQQFYCCGKLREISLTIPKTQKSNCKTCNHSKGCCDNKYQFFKVNDNHFISDNIKAPVKQFSDLLLYTPSFSDIIFSSHQIFFCNKCNAPPVHYGVASYVYNCVFRI